VRLSDESTAKFEIELVNKQVQKIRQAKKDCQTHYGKQLGCGTCKALQLCVWIDELVDTIEAMRKHIEALQQENEQLRAKLEERAARMRELLTKAYDEIEEYKCLWKGSKPSGCDCPKPTALQDEIEQTLAEIDKAIGGKEDA